MFWAESSVRELSPKTHVVPQTAGMRFKPHLNLDDWAANHMLCNFDLQVAAAVICGITFAGGKLIAPMLALDRVSAVPLPQDHRACAPVDGQNMESRPQPLHDRFTAACAPPVHDTKDDDHGSQASR